VCLASDPFHVKPHRATNLWTDVACGTENTNNCAVDSVTVTHENPYSCFAVRELRCQLDHLRRDSFVNTVCRQVTQGTAHAKNEQRCTAKRAVFCSVCRYFILINLSLILSKYGVLETSILSIGCDTFRDQIFGFEAGNSIVHGNERQRRSSALWVNISIGSGFSDRYHTTRQCTEFTTAGLKAADYRDVISCFELASSRSDASSLCVPTSWQMATWLISLLYSR